MAEASDARTQQVVVNISLAVGLLEKVDQAAEESGVSRAAFIRQALERALEDAEDTAISTARLQDPGDPVVPWDQVNAEAQLT